MAIRNIPLKMGGQQIQGLGDAVDANDAVNKGQLDAATTGLGTVTSVALSGGTTGLSVSGSPITSSGTITLSGTLAVANGGTGQTSYTDGQLLIGNTTGNTLTKATLTAGTGVTITNGGGSITIAATGSWTLLTKAADQSTTSASFADDNTLKFSVSANTTYVFRGVVSIDAGAGGFQIAINGPSTPTESRVNAGTSTTITAYDSSFATNAGSGVFQFSFQGKLENGANAGTLAIRIRQNTASGTTTFEKGSWLEYRSI